MTQELASQSAIPDFFISYTGQDQSWAEWIAWVLEEAGFSVVIQAWDFKVGGNFVLDMQRATQAKRTIAVLSALYLNKPFPQPEWAAAFAQDPTSQDRKLIPVRIEECSPPGLLAQIVYVDVFGCEEAEAQSRLLSALAEGRKKPAQRPRFPGVTPHRATPQQVPFPGRSSIAIQPQATDSSEPSQGTQRSHTSTRPPVAEPEQGTQQEQKTGTGKTQPAVPLSLSAYDESTWVGRDSLIATLTQKLRAGCRILTLLGITGIGKTALAERVVVELGSLGKPFRRLNFDDRGQDKDFLSGALALLPKLGEVVTTEDQKDPENALKHILQVLRTKPFFLQIDSVEMLLEGDEQQGWNAFKDCLWIDFFQQILAGDECQSQIILTTQAMPEELDVVGSRYFRCWHMQSLGGLSESEQEQLFKKNGLEADPDGLLKHISRLYDGHPLVLQVIAKDILEGSCKGDVSLYWQRYQAEFVEVESDRTRKGSSPRALQLRVKQRVKQSLERLPEKALQMVCRCSVYRRPVSEPFWCSMLWNRSEDEQWKALEVLRSRNLVEEEVRGDGLVLVRQHNLIKRVGNELLRAKQDEYTQAHQVAVKIWLQSYEPEDSAPNLEQVRGKLEAFHHHCEIQEWDAAAAILLDQKVGSQLHTWSHFREMLPLYQRLLSKVGAAVDMDCEIGIGNAYLDLSNYPQAIEHYQRSLKTAREIGDRSRQSWALHNLGLVYRYLSDYSQAIDYHQQSLTIDHEIGDRQGIGITLGDLGIAYDSLGNHQQAIEYYQQSLAIARETGNRQGEEHVLISLGIAYDSLGNHQQAIEYYQQSLAIAREIGDRQGEGIALTNLGRACYRLDNYQQAIEHYQQRLAIAREVGSLQGEGLALLNWGRALLKLEQYPENLQHLQASLDIFQAIGDRSNEAATLLYLGELYHKTHQPEQAISYCNQALSIAYELGTPLVKECEDMLATLRSEGQPQADRTQPQLEVEAETQAPTQLTNSDQPEGSSPSPAPGIVLNQQNTNAGRDQIIINQPSGDLRIGG